MDILTQQLIGTFVFLGSVGAMVYLLADFKKTEKLKGVLPEPTSSSQPVYLKECHYIYPADPKAKAV